MQSKEGGTMTVEEMRIALNMSKKDFSRQYNIPYRTIQDWESGSRVPPDYVIELLGRVVEYDLKEDESKRINRLNAYRKGISKVLKKQGK